MLRVTVLAGGVGGSKFVLGLRRALDGTGAEITVVVNTGDDMWLSGLRVCPDLDSMMYALAGVNDRDRGWGREGETTRASEELTAYGLGAPWFVLGDLDLGTHVARTGLLRAGAPLSDATAHLCRRWDLGVRLLPATDDAVETQVVVPDGDGTRLLHFEEWWVRHRAALPALGFTSTDPAGGRPAPGVVEAVLGADLVLLAPSNPVVSIGTVLAVPGIAEAVRATSARVVGVSPVIGGAVVRGMADVCLRAVGVEVDASAVARHYGARSAGGFLDGWLVDTADRAAVAALAAEGIAAAAEPLWMTDEEASARIARHALDLASTRR